MAGVNKVTLARPAAARGVLGSRPSLASGSLTGARTAGVVQSHPELV
jgi:hypothetical protein